MNQSRPNSGSDLPSMRLIRPLAARMFVLSILAVAGLMGYLLWSSYRDSLTLAETSTRNMAWLLESRLDATLRRVDTVLRGQAVDLAKYPQTMDARRAHVYRETIEQELNLRLGSFPEVAGLRAFDANGDLLYTSGRTPGMNPSISDRDYFFQARALKEDKLVYSEVIDSKITHTPVFVTALAVRDPQGKFLGIVTAAINLDHFSQLLRSIDLGPNSTIAIRRSDDFRLVARWPALPGEVNKPLAPGHPNRVVIEAGKKIATTDTHAQTDDVRRVFTLHALDNFPFYVLVGVARDDMLQGWRHRLAVVVVAGAWVMLLCFCLVRILRQSEKRLLHAHEELKRNQDELKDSERRLRTLFDEAPVGHAVNRLRDGKFLAINQVFADITGYSKDELNKLSYWDLTPERYADEEARQLELLRTTGSYGPYEKHYIHRDGNWVPVRLQGCVVHGPDGEPLILSVVENISERRKAEQRIRLLASVFHYSGEAILITDQDNRIVEVNPSFSRMTGYGAEEVMGQNPRLLSSGRTTVEEYRAMWQAIKDNGRWQGELWDRHKDGHVYPKWITISTIRDDAGQISHYIANFTDITEHKAVEERIHYIAHHDGLTKLPNRISLQERLEPMLANAGRDGMPMSVLFVDLDRFKIINDTLGHHTGDDMLVEVAQRLSDSVGERDLVARHGGDEFVVVLNGVGRGSAAAFAERLIASLSRPYLINATELHSTPSIGISIFPVDGATGEELLKNADTAMYHAKAAGRNNYQFFSPVMNEAASERLMLESNLRQALVRQEFLLHYQPQVDGVTGRVVGVEALVRWNHPQHGLVPPIKFIPIAEDSGLIVPLGTWVLGEALRQLRAWRDAGIDHLRMAVNLSANQLRDPTLAIRIGAMLREHGLEGRDLELEITESVAMQDPARSASLMQQLHHIGVELAIDDFGTGYSSLAYLKQLPLDRLKLDRSFVTDIERDSNDAAICTATISLAHSLNLAVVAEGVETEAQRDYLKRLKCDLLQGYLFSKPLPAEECLAFIRRNHDLLQEEATLLAE